MKHKIHTFLLLAILLGICSSNLLATPCTVAYVWPVTGSTAPTAAQARQHNSVVATVTFADADTSCVVTHNMQLPNATGANGIPKVIFTPIAAGSVTATPFVAFTNAVSITIDKNTTTTSSNLTVRVTVERPAATVK